MIISRNKYYDRTFRLLLNFQTFILARYFHSSFLHVTHVQHNKSHSLECDNPQKGITKLSSCLWAHFDSLWRKNEFLGWNHLSQELSAFLAFERSNWFVSTKVSHPHLQQRSKYTAMLDWSCYDPTWGQYQKSICDPVAFSALTQCQPWVLWVGS